MYSTLSALFWSSPCMYDTRLPDNLFRSSSTTKRFLFPEQGIGTALAWRLYSINLFYHLYVARGTLLSCLCVKSKQRCGSSKASPRGTPSQHTLSLIRRLLTYIISDTQFSSDTPCERDQLRCGRHNVRFSFAISAIHFSCD
jgi:hypothetical protein